MDSSSIRAVNAYRGSQKMLENTPTSPLESGDNSQASFDTLVKDALQGAIDSQHKAEQTKVDGLLGKTDITNVVTAVAEAELSLNAVVNIRDRMISAYQEILRMPI